MSVERTLWEEDATGLADLVRRGELSAIELTDAAIARAEATRPEINATAEPLYEAARARNPIRWSGDIRNWQPAGPVSLNPGNPAAQGGSTQTKSHA